MKKELEFEDISYSNLLVERSIVIGLQDKYIDDGILRLIDFKESVRSVNFKEIKFVNCKFDANIVNCNFEDCFFINCTFTGDIDNCLFRDCDFINCKFKTNLQSTKFVGSTLIDCVFNIEELVNTLNIDCAYFRCNFEKYSYDPNLFDGECDFTKCKGELYSEL